MSNQSEQQAIVAVPTISFQMASTLCACTRPYAEDLFSSHPHPPFRSDGLELDESVPLGHLVQTLTGDVQCFGSGAIVPSGAVEGVQDSAFLGVVERFVHMVSFSSALDALILFMCMCFNSSENSCIASAITVL